MIVKSPADNFSLLSTLGEKVGPETKITVPIENFFDYNYVGKNSKLEVPPERFYNFKENMDISNPIFYH